MLTDGWYNPLMARAFPGDQGCYDLVREAMGILGVKMEADPMSESAAGAFEVVATIARRGDVVVMEHGDGRQHVGVCVSPSECLHLGSGTTRVDKLGLLEQCGCVRRRLRHRDLAGVQG